MYDAMKHNINVVYHTIVFAFINDVYSCLKECILKTNCLIFLNIPPSSVIRQNS